MSTSPIPAFPPPGFQRILLPKPVSKRFLQQVLPRPSERERWTYITEQTVLGAGRGDIQLAACRDNRPGRLPWNLRLALPMGIFLKVLPSPWREQPQSTTRELWVGDWSKPQAKGQFVLQQTPRVITWLETLLSNPQHSGIHQANQLPFSLSKDPPTIPDFSRNP